jgi:hypothetical protein
MTTTIGDAIGRALASSPAQASRPPVAAIHPSRPISSELAPALHAARKLAEGPIRYNAAGGDVVTIPRDPIVATPAARAEAAGRALGLARTLEPCPPEVVRRWLLSLSALMERTPPADELDAKVRALCGALDLPSCCYTAETLRAAGRALRWFPGLAALVETLEPFAAPLRAELAALEAVARSNDPPKASEAPRRRIVDPVDPEKAKAAAAELRAIVEARDPPKRPRPSYLSPEALAALRKPPSPVGGAA